LNPSKLGIGVEQKEEIARPNTKIDIKVNWNLPAGTAQVEEKKQVRPVAKERDIWTDEEIMLQETEIQDDWLQPEFDIMLIQKVGTEDVFLGLSGKDPSSVNCDGFTIKIKMPGCTMKDIQVDVKK